MPGALSTARLPVLWDSAPGEVPWLLWQLADSAFPAGGFAHSLGLEAAWQQGELRGVEELRAFTEASLRQCGRAGLPFVAAAHQQPARLPELDRLCEAFTTNHVANRASRLQGRALLASAARIFASPAVQAIRHSGGDEPACGHLAPLFGAITRALGVAALPAARLFLFLHLRGLVAAAVRLGIVGPFQGQALQHALATPAEEVLLRCRNVKVDDIAQTAPLLDLWQANHDRLYSRLFQS